ncbi:MAG: hypothetical protein WCE44_12795 [Candidatus Velthaea sp.]|jgi:hypothetical protein
MSDEKNALPGEVDDHPDSGMPRELRTQADNDRVLTHEEARAGGIRAAEIVYGDTDLNPNADDQRDVHAGNA